MKMIIIIMMTMTMKLNKRKILKIKDFMLCEKSKEEMKLKGKSFLP